MRQPGLIGGERLASTLHEQLGDLKIEDLPKPFMAVSTDLVTGHEVWLKEGSLVDGVRASYSMPGVFPPVQYDGRWLVDGALVNPVPVSCCRALGADLVIAVNVNADTLGKVRGPLKAFSTGFDLDLIEEMRQAEIPEKAWPRNLDGVVRARLSAGAGHAQPVRRDGRLPGDRTRPHQPEPAGR